MRIDESLLEDDRDAEFEGETEDIRGEQNTSTYIGNFANYGEYGEFNLQFLSFHKS